MNKVFYDETSERALLGSMIIDNKCICNIMTKLTSRMLYFSKHKVIFDSILNLYKSGVNVDLITLSTALMNNGLLEQAGGAGYVADLTSEVSGSTNADYYMDNIIRYAQSRAIKSLLLTNLEKLGSEENGEIIRDIEDKVFRIAASTTTTKVWTPDELASEFNEYIKYNEETWGTDKGIKVGFPTLDRLTDGFQNSDVIVIGARPSIGKTALAISMMQNLLEKNIPVGFISAEMNHMQIMERMISQRTRINVSTLRSGKYSAHVKEILFKATHYYGSRQFYIDDTPNISLNSLVSSIRHMKIHNGIRIVFIDYIGLISVEGNAPVWERLGEISRTLKGLARELNIPIVALSQLGREAEGSSPTIANIRGSGAIEQDADLVFLLDGDRDLSSYSNSNPYLDRNLILAKHRNGPCGKIYLDFEKEFTIFNEAYDQESRADAEQKKSAKKE